MPPGPYRMSHRHLRSKPDSTGEEDYPHSGYELLPAASVDGNNNTSQPVADFILKLWNIVNCPSHASIIGWDRQGTSFIILDESAFVSRVMSGYFRHRNFMSFHRQLNQYGFRRRKTVRTRAELDGSVQNVEGPIMFAHPYFIRGRHDLLQMITRRDRETKDTSQQTVQRRLENIELMMERLENNQRYMCSQLEFFQSAHSEFLKELKSLQVRHEKHEHLINRLISFIMNFIVSTTAKMNSSQSGGQPGSSAQPMPDPRYFNQSQMSVYDGSNQNCNHCVEWINQLDARLHDGQRRDEENDRRPLAITAHGETNVDNGTDWNTFNSLFGPQDCEGDATLTPQKQSEPNEPSDYLF
ncbi:hypothetical protein ACOME3_005484 [Neoechinorhynchus agilis]